MKFSTPVSLLGKILNRFCFLSTFLLFPIFASYGQGMFSIPSNPSVSIFFGSGTFILPVRLDNMGDEPDLKSIVMTYNGDVQSGGEFTIDGQGGFENCSNACGDTPLQETDFQLFDLDGLGSCDTNNQTNADSGFIRIPNPAIGVYIIELRGGIAGMGCNEFDPESTRTFTLTVLPAPSTIPTMTEWGIFLFALLVLGLGLVTVYNTRLTLTTEKGEAVNVPSFQLPFKKTGFLRSLKHAVGIGLSGLALIYLGWGEITPLDMAGVLMAVPIVAYLLHLQPFFLALLFLTFGSTQVASAQSPPLEFLNLSAIHSTPLGNDFTVSLKLKDNMGDMPDLRLASIIVTSGVGTVDQGKELIPNGANCDGTGVSFVVTDVDNFCSQTGNGNASLDLDTGNLFFPQPAVGTYLITLKGESKNTNGDVVRQVEVPITLNVNVAAIPTMGEWGMLYFFLIMLTMGLVTVYNAHYSMAVSTGEGMTIKRFQLPFDKSAFRHSLKHALGIGLCGLALIYLGWGEITPLDVMGVLMTVPMVAYLLHLQPFFKQGEE